MAYTRLSITAVLFLLTYLPVFPVLAQEWAAESQNYSHGFFVPLLSAYFLWLKREDIKKTVSVPSWAGVFIIFAGLVMYMLAISGYQFFFQCLSMVIVLFGIVYAGAGRDMAKKASFAIGYLLLMIPLPTIVFNTIAYHMRMFVAAPVYFLVRLLGISATKAENIITMPTCSFVIASECSGFRGFTVFAAASLAIGYIFHKSMKERVGLFVFSLALAIVMNIVRITAIAFITNLLSLDRILLVIDRTAGYIVLVIGVMILFAVSDLLRKKR